MERENADDMAAFFSKKTSAIREEVAADKAAPINAAAHVERLVLRLKAFGATAEEILAALTGAVAKITDDRPFEREHVKKISPKPKGKVHAKSGRPAASKRKAKTARR